MLVTFKQRQNVEAGYWRGLLGMSTGLPSRWRGLRGGGKPTGATRDFHADSERRRGNAKSGNRVFGITTVLPQGEVAPLQRRKDRGTGAIIMKENFVLVGTKIKKIRRRAQATAEERLT